MGEITTLPIEGDNGLAWRDLYFRENKLRIELVQELAAEKTKMRAVVQKSTAFARTMMSAPDWSLQRIYEMGKEMFDWLVAEYSNYMKGS